MISLQCIAPSSCIAGQSLTATVAAFIKVCLASAPSSLSTTAGYLLTTSSLSRQMIILIIMDQPTVTAKQCSTERLKEGHAEMSQ